MLEQPEQILNFVAHALEADKATQQDEEDADEVILEKSSKEKGKEREMRSGGIGLADLRIVDEDELEAREREEVRQREEMEDENDEDREIPGLGKDEMAMTALTLLLAVLEGECPATFHFLRSRLTCRHFSQRTPHDGINASAVPHKHSPHRPTRLAFPPHPSTSSRSSRRPLPTTTFFSRSRTSIHLILNPGPTRRFSRNLPILSQTPARPTPPSPSSRTRSTSFTYQHS